MIFRSKFAIVSTFLGHKETYLALSLTVFLLIIEVSNPMNFNYPTIFRCFFSNYVPIWISFILINIGNYERTIQSYNYLAVYGVAFLLAFYVAFFLYQTIALSIILGVYNILFSVIIVHKWFRPRPYFKANRISG